MRAAATVRRSPSRPRRGRPPALPGRARPHRVVTFLTDAEMAKLEQICESEEKSLSAVAHEILARSLSRRGDVRVSVDESK